jgi:hypothetical protein
VEWIGRAVARGNTTAAQPSGEHPLELAGLPNVRDRISHGVSSRHGREWPDSAASAEFAWQQHGGDDDPPSKSYTASCSCQVTEQIETGPRLASLRAAVRTTWIQPDRSFRVAITREMRLGSRCRRRKLTD